MPDETFADRLAALKDIVPPTYRKHLSNTFSTTSSWVQTTLNYGGKTLWVVSTSVLLLGVPWALAFAEEQQMAEMEREMKMQQSANEVSFDTHISGARGKTSANGEIIASYSAATIAGKARSVNGYVVCSFLHCSHAHVLKMPFFLRPCTTIFFGGGDWSERKKCHQFYQFPTFCSFRLHVSQYHSRTATEPPYGWH